MELARSPRVNQLVFGILLVLLSMTEIPILQIEKAVITPFHFVALLITLPLLLWKPAIIKLNRYLLLLICYIFFINLLHIATARVTSIIYTVVFVYEFIFLSSLLRFVKPHELKKIFLFIVVLYFINILVTFFLLKLGLYTKEIGFIFRAYEGQRPMGFSSEPSYAAFIVAVAFICYNELKMEIEGKNAFWALIIFILTVVLSTSAYGLIYVAISIIYMVIKQASRMPFKYRLMFYGTISVIALAVIVYLSSAESGPVQRLFQVANTLASDKSLNDKLELIGEIDASAWTRFGPTWMLFQENGLDAGLLFGHGSGAASIFFQEQLVGILVDPDKTSVDLGIIPGFIYDFGLVGFVILLFFIYRILNRNKYFFALTILFFFNAGINTQIMWYCIVAFTITSGTINQMKLAKRNEWNLKQLPEVG